MRDIKQMRHVLICALLLLSACHDVHSGDDHKIGDWTISAQQQTVEDNKIIYGKLLQIEKNQQIIIKGLRKYGLNMYVK